MDSSLSSAPQVQEITSESDELISSPDSNETLSNMTSSGSESAINSSALLSSGALLARLLLKGQSLWLECRCVLDPHAAHFPL